MKNPIRILYVDDYPLDRELVRDALEREHGGFELVEASSRRDFETRLAQGGFDLILSDFNILGFEGLQVLDAVRQAGLDIPVIIVTGTGSEEVAAEAIKRGAADYVIKTPKHILRLPLIIQSELEKRQLEADRREAEEKLQESEDKFKYVFDHSVAGKSFTLPSGELNVNKAFCTMVGYTARELKHRRWQTITHPEDVDLTNKANKALISGKKDSMRFIKRFIHKNGSIVWADVASALRRDKDGKPMYFMSTFLDITERMRAEEQIRKLNAELEQRVEERTQELRLAQDKIVRQEKLAMLGQLAGGVGHELRNPLGIISNAIYYLKLIQPDADEKVKEYQELISREVLTSEKIITDLLDYSRLESMERDQVSVMELVQWSLMRFSPPSEIKTTLRIPGDLPEIFVDMGQMQQVLGNLIINACQAMVPQGKTSGKSAKGAVIKGSSPDSSRSHRLTISARTQKGMVALSVKDTGVGITPENLRRIFEPLFTTKSKGIGLGLPVSRKLAEANGGQIEVKSQAGKGSTFTLYLPVKGE